MATCPNCKKEVNKPSKTWKYGPFTVKAYSCPNCGVQFRDYTREGKHSFALKLQKGKGYIKAWKIAIALFVDRILGQYLQFIILYFSQDVQTYGQVDPVWESSLQDELYETRWFSISGTC